VDGLCGEIFGKLERLILNDSVLAHVETDDLAPYPLDVVVHGGDGSGAFAHLFGIAHMSLSIPDSAVPGERPRCWSRFSVHGYLIGEGPADQHQLAPERLGGLGQIAETLHCIGPRDPLYTTLLHKMPYSGIL